MANEINIDLGKRRSLKGNIGVPGYLGKGDTGTGIESITYKGEDESGGNMYTVLLTDGTSYDITAPKGAAGADGITPHIGDNGNWYLGYTDTGKPSRGETGAQGTPGKDGANGKDGKPGEKGADGAPGIYYGTTQPTGDTHPVWIDPDGGPDDGGLLPTVTADDNGKVLRVDNGAWAAAAINDANGVSF